MNDDEVDVVLAQIRHRDAVRILTVSAIVGVPLLVPIVLGLELGPVWDTVLPSALGLCVFAALTAALHLRRNRERYGRLVPAAEDGDVVGALRTRARRRARR